MQTMSPADPASQNASVTVSSKFCIQNNFKAASWDGPASQTNQLGLHISFTLSHHRDWTKNNTASSPGTWSLPQFSESPKDAITPEQQEAV